MTPVEIIILDAITVRVEKVAEAVHQERFIEASNHANHIASLGEAIQHICDEKHDNYVSIRKGGKK